MSQEVSPHLNKNCPLDAVIKVLKEDEGSIFFAMFAPFSQGVASIILQSLSTSLA